MSLTNPTNVVTEQRLAEFYQAIFPYLGGYGGTGIDYTETERVVGTWIDGKPLYQKTIDFGKAPNIGTKNVAHNISNVDNIWVSGGYLYDQSNGNRYLIPFNSLSAASSSIYVYANGTNVGMSTQADRSSWTSILTVQYTKTTDTAGTKKYLGVPAVHYTTDEQVIGTWIDGKPLYQKSVTGTTNFDGSTAMATFDSTFNIVDLKAYIVAAEKGIQFNPFWYSVDNYWCMRIEDNKLIGTGTTVFYNNKDFVVTVRYTKTTD